MVVLSSISPDTGQMVTSGDYLDVTTPQIEAGTGASSFIVTGTAPATRASDMVTVPIKNNLYNLPFTVLCEVHKNWYKTPNAAPRVFDTYRHQADAGDRNGVWFIRWVRRFSVL